MTASQLKSALNEETNLQGEIAKKLAAEIRKRLKAEKISFSNIRTKKWASNQAQFFVRLWGPEQIKNFDRVKQLVQELTPKDTVAVKYKISTYGDRNNDSHRDITLWIWSPS